MARVAYVPSLPKAMPSRSKHPEYDGLPMVVPITDVSFFRHCLTQSRNVQALRLLDHFEAAAETIGKLGFFFDHADLPLDEQIEALRNINRAMEHLDNALTACQSLAVPELRAKKRMPAGRVREK